MAAARHNLTRRALLGAGGAACALLVTETAAVAAGRTRWERALAAFRRSEARLADFRRNGARLAAAAGAGPDCSVLDDRFSDFECARLQALRRLLRVPAPDLAALSLKIGLAVDERAWELTGAEPCLATLKADARRLAYGS